jgi:hypothetical protein
MERKPYLAADNEGLLPYLFEVINHHFFADTLKDPFYELNVHWMDLILILRFLVTKHEVERDLIRLVHYWPMAPHHFPYMEFKRAGDGFQVSVSALDQLIRSVRVARVDPKNDNV